MTQWGLARALGVSQPRVAEIEGARTTARLDTVAKLAAVFGIEPWRLLKQRPEISGTRPAAIRRSQNVSRSRRHHPHLGQADTHRTSRPSPKTIGRRDDYA